MNPTFDQPRAEALKAISESIEALRNAPDLDALRDQQRVARNTLLKAWPELIGDDEHSDWLNKLDVAVRDGERVFWEKNPDPAQAQLSNWAKAAASQRKQDRLIMWKLPQFSDHLIVGEDRQRLLLASGFGAGRA
ncbi:hypothetical protein M2401_003685 [Pseudomonas sp. JUb42]|uniref:hypothetical protein n=1 Tax=Pseudomonas sp. JUb42 TaxID=2940611 RepID=UPI002168CA8C|nr:hypothetical protein [Pseudomonas sp. JUb42]MCS3469945.1 hypothetical protein [Pseudomonas sp. JUb42]